MIPGNRSKFDKMKKVAALQTQKGPWSRDVSSTLRKGLSAAPPDLSKQKKVQALQQQKGPWSSQSSTQSQPPPEPTPSSHSSSKRSKMMALQEQKGPWNRQHPPSPREDDRSQTRPTPSPRQSYSRKSMPDVSKDFLELGLDEPPRPPPPPPPKSAAKSRRPTQTTPTTSGHLAADVLKSPKNVMCLSMAVGLVRQQWALSLQSSVCRLFHTWRRNTVVAMKVDSKRPQSDKEKTERSVLLWLLGSSRKKSLQHAWKKWMFAVVAMQNLDKNKSIQELSDALAKENDQYKLKLTDIMEKVKQRDGFYRHSAVKNTMYSFFRIKAKMALKKRFDAWSRVTWQMSYDQALRREKFKMEIGFQAINSEKEVLKETEVYSARLESTLLCLLAFQNWKLKMKDDQYKESHRKWAEEKKIIQENLNSLEKSLLGLNRKEQEMVTLARTRGLEMYASLYSISEKLNKCSSLSTPQVEVPGGNIGSQPGLLKKKKKLLFEDVSVK